MYKVIPNFGDLMGLGGNLSKGGYLFGEETEVVGHDERHHPVSIHLTSARTTQTKGSREKHSSRTRREGRRLQEEIEKETYA